METFTVTLTKEKETPNTWKYKENATPGSPPLVQNVYLPKWLGELPPTIKVTVEAA